MKSKKKKEYVFCLSDQERYNDKGYTALSLQSNAKDVMKVPINFPLSLKLSKENPEVEPERHIQKFSELQIICLHLRRRKRYALFRKKMLLSP